MDFFEYHELNQHNNDISEWKYASDLIMSAFSWENLARQCRFSILEERRVSSNHLSKVNNTDTMQSWYKRKFDHLLNKLHALFVEFLRHTPG